MHAALSLMVEREIDGGLNSRAPTGPYGRACLRILNRIRPGTIFIAYLEEFLNIRLVNACCMPTHPSNSSSALSLL